jgi:hypothetical protein
MKPRGQGAPIDLTGHVYGRVEVLEADLFKYLNNIGYGEAEPTADQICAALDCTRDLLRPIILRRYANHSIGTCGQGSEQTFHITRSPWGPNDSPQDNGEQPTETPTAKTARTRGGRPKKTPRLAPLGPYAPVPRAILKDPNLSIGAKGLAAILIDRLNLGPWNKDLHVDTSYPELSEGTKNANRWTLMRLTGELVSAHHLVAESLGRGGVRFTFTEKDEQ